VIKKKKLLFQLHSDQLISRCISATDYWVWWCLWSTRKQAVLHVV